MRNHANPFFVTSAQIARAQRWPIGTAVTVTLDDGSQLDTVTGSAPYRNAVIDRKRAPAWEILVGAGGTRGPHALARVVERVDVS